MKSLVRWLLLLPAAVIGGWAVQFVNEEFGPPSWVLFDIWRVWSFTMAFIAVGCYIAPCFKFATSIILAILICVAWATLILLSKPGEINVPMWKVVLQTIVMILSAFVACAFVKGMVDEKRRDEEYQKMMREKLLKGEI